MLFEILGISWIEEAKVNEEIHATSECYDDKVVLLVPALLGTSLKINLSLNMSYIV